MSIYSYFSVKPCRITIDALEALEKDLKSEVPTPLISDPYCFEPCGHLLCEDRTSQAARRVLPFPLSCIPDNCPKCNVEVIKLVPDLATSSVVFLLEEAVRRFKNSRQKRINDPVNISTLFLIALQNHNALLLSCGHITAKAVFEKKKVCILCQEKPSLTVPHPTLSKLSHSITQHILSPLLKTICYEKIARFQFAEALNIIEFLIEMDQPAEDLIKMTAQALLQFPYGISLHAVSFLFLKMSSSQRTQFKDLICEKLHTTTQTPWTTPLPNNYLEVVENLYFFYFPKLSQDDRNLIAYFDSDKFLKINEIRENLLLWRWVAFLVYSSDNDLQMTGISIISDITDTPIDESISLRIAQRVARLCDEMPALWSVATAFIRKNFPDALKNLREDIKLTLSKRVANKENDGIAHQT